MSDAAEIFIALVDEVLRTRGRVLAATAQFGSDDGLTGSQMTVSCMTMAGPEVDPVGVVLEAM